MTATIKDTTLRLAVLVALRDQVDAEVQSLRNDALTEMQQLREVVGMKAVEVLLPNGEHIANVSIVDSKPVATIVDEVAFGAWLAEAYPTEVETHYAVREEHLPHIAATHPEWVITVQRPRTKFVSVLLDNAEGDDPVVDSTTGQIIDGVTRRSPKAPYVSTTFVGGRNGLGRAAIAEAWQRGTLQPVVPLLAEGDR